MAEKVLQTRIINKHTTYDVATNNTTFIPKEGEIILVKLPASASQNVDKPTYLAKIGDGTSNLKSLNWMAGTAADVYSWAKEAALVITGNDATGNVITGITADKDGVHVTKATVATATSVESQITAAIEKLDGTVSGSGFVSSISQTNGKVTATLRALTAADIPSITHEKISDFDTEVQALIDATVVNKYVLTSDFNTFKTNNTKAIEDAAAGAVSTVVGGDADTTYAKTIKGAKEFATAAATKAKEDAIADAKNKADAVLGTANDASTANTVYGAKKAVAEEAQARAKAVEDEAKARVEADNALDLRVDSLEAKVKDVTTVMDFVGAGATLPAVASSQKGDVFVISSGDDAGKEYVFDGSKWVELGSTSATDTAVAKNKADIAALDEYVGKTDPEKGLTKRITELEGEVDVLNTFKNTTVPATYETIAEANKVRNRVGALETTVNTATTGLKDRMTKAETDINNISKSGGTIDTKIDEAIKALDENTWSAEDGIKVVTAVGETDGKISVTRRALVAADIPTLAMSKVTGLEALNNAVTDSETGLAKRALKTELDVVDGKVDDIKANYLKVGAKVGTTSTANGSADVFAFINQDGDTIIFDCGGVE